MLINSDELPYTYEIDNLFVILSPLIHPSVDSSVNMRSFNDDELNQRYPGIKKVNDMKLYSSDNADKVSQKNLTEMISNLRLF